MATRAKLAKTGLIVMGSSAMIFLVAAVVGLEFYRSIPRTLGNLLGIAMLCAMAGFPLGIIILVVALLKQDFPSRAEVHTKFAPDFGKLRQHIQDAEDEDGDTQQAPQAPESESE